MAKSEVFETVTPEGRLLFPHLFEPYAGIENADPNYSCLLVFPKDADLSRLRSIVTQAAAGMKNPKGGRNPILDGDDRAEEWGEAFRNSWYIRITSRFQPAVINRKKEEILDPDKVYSGCYARASVRAYSYEKAGNKGVAFGLNAVQILRDGEHLGGSKAAIAQFDDLPDDGSIEDDPFSE